jgi:putative addiction module CopG family antidote
VKVDLTPELEQIVLDEIKNGHFRSAEEVISEALRSLRKKQESSASAAPNRGQVEAVRNMLTFLERNRVRLEGISVKELLHEGHRL